MAEEQPTVTAPIGRLLPLIHRTSKDIMCGIAGYVVGRGAEEPPATVIEKMLAKIAHRGPDSEGVFAEGGVVLGFRRLALIDLAGGDQPLYNEDRSVVVCCNGEIFNHKELRAHLCAKGHTFSTGSDIEVLVHLYEEYGTDLTRHLNGQFAFAIYDRCKQVILLGRDHSGIAPLFFCRKGSGLLFASEIKALLAHPDMHAARVDIVGLDQVICFPGLVSPRTMFADVEALEPGTLLMWKDGDVRRARYWDLDFPRQEVGPAAPSLSAEKYEERLSTLFRQAVEKRLQADVPVGVYLSGGLDSSMIACMAKQVSKQRISTFSVIFSDPKYTEESYQRMVVEATGSDHHELCFKHEDVMEHLQTMIYHAESPVKESYNICSLLLSRLTRAAGCKAILTGEGADELFAGYPAYKFAALQARRPRPVSAEERSQRDILWGTDFGYEREYSSFSTRRARLFSRRAQEYLRESNALNAAVLDGARLRGRHIVNQRSYADFKLRLADHLLTEHGDRMLLAHSVEGRFPFLDQELVELAQQIPPDMKLSGFNEKYILKRIARNFVPPAIVEREKHGFHGAGTAVLLKLAGDQVRDWLSPERLVRHGFFDSSYVTGLLDRYSQPDFVQDARVEDDELMIALTFSIFLEVFELPSL